MKINHKKGDIYRVSILEGEENFRYLYERIDGVWYSGKGFYNLNKCFKNESLILEQQFQILMRDENFNKLEL